MYGSRDVKLANMLTSLNNIFFKKNEPTPAFFVSFRSSQTQILLKKIVGFSGIQTWTVAVEGGHADHLTPTTALSNSIVTFG